MDHSPENLEYYSQEQKNNQKKEEKPEFQPRPKSQIILAWVLIAVVLFAFFGTCYWLVNYGRV